MDAAPQKHFAIWRLGPPWSWVIVDDRKGWQTIYDATPRTQAEAEAEADRLNRERRTGEGEDTWR